ncbi:MAG TPA: MOSC N-terminal beta barrel domain-containing protein, partial [Solirubrobacteraceae bacterium]|nr:MOSC N-terminal beta barrel domain-containing protein [Solirubrobacteraceae bacterium]
MARVLHVQPRAAHGERLAGTVGELWRYPVKSMLGSQVPEVLVTDHGCLGDRAWALRDVASGRIASAKRFPRLLAFRATYAVEPTPQERGRARIDTPDGRSISADDPAASAIISEILGHELRLESQPHADEKTG